MAAIDSTPTPSHDPLDTTVLEAWRGRDDGPGAEHRRWFHAVLPAGHQDAARDATALIGFASDAGVARNLGRTGAAAAPRALRSALASLSYEGEVGSVTDAGDVVVRGDELEAGHAALGRAVADELRAGRFVTVLGGGHETAFGSYLGLRDGLQPGTRLGVLNLDAHFDLRRAERPSSGTPFLQMADDRAARGESFDYAVVGISRPNNTGVLFETAERLGVRYLEDEDAQDPADVVRFVNEFAAGVDALYLTIDLDVLPAAVAPGVSAPAGFGVPLPAIRAAALAAAATGKLALLDVVELNPSFDVDARTARTAARLIHDVVTRRA